MDLPSEYDYDNPLRVADVLRQMHRMDDALMECAKSTDRRAISLKIRVLRNARRVHEAKLLLDAHDPDLDDAELRANRIAVLDRLHGYDELCGLLGGLHHEALIRSDDPFLYRVTIAEARAFASRGLNVEAKAGFERAVEQRPDSAIANGWLLNGLMRLGRVPEARDLAIGLLGRDRPNQWRLDASAGRVLLRLGYSDLAVIALRRARDAQPAHPQTLRWLASTLRTIGDVAGATAVLDEAKGIWIEADEHRLSLAEHPFVLVERALLMLARYDGADGDWLTRAMEFARSALAISAGSAEAAWALARIFRAQDDEHGILAMKQLTRDHPGNANLSTELGHALADVGRFDESVDVYERVLVTNPKNREALLGRLTVHATRTLPTGTGKPTDRRTSLVPSAEESRPLRESVAALRTEVPDDVVLLSVAGERLAQRGHYSLAMDLFEIVMNGRANPAHYFTYAGAVRAWAWARDFDTAESVLSRAATVAWQPTRHSVIDDDGLPLLVGLAKGMLLGDQGRYREAKEQFTRLARKLQAMPDEARSRDDVAAVALWRSSSHRWLSELGEAQHVIEEALQPGPRQSTYFTRAAELNDELGWILIDRDDPVRAEVHFSRSLDLDPRLPGSLRGLIQTLRLTGNQERAKAMAARAIALHPSNMTMVCEAAWLRGEAGHFREAVDLFDQALSREPANMHALEWKIHYLTRFGMLAQAAEVATRAIALRPESPEILEAASAVQLRSGNGEQARAVAFDSASQRLNDHRFVIVAAKVCEQSHPSGRCCEVWTERLRRLRDRPEAARMHVSMLRTRTQLAAARRAVEEHLQCHDWSGLQVELAELHLEADNVEAALDELHKVYARVPWSWRVARRIAGVLATYNQLDRAVQFVASAIDRARGASPGVEPIELLVLHAEVLLRANRFEEAIAVARKATHPTRHVIEARTILIDALGGAGMMDEALAEAEHLSADRPASRRARLALARSLDASRRATDAVELLDDCASWLPPHPPAIVTASLMLRGLKRRQRALNLIEKSLDVSPDDPGLRAEKGWILLDDERWREARTCFKRLTQGKKRHERALGHAGLGWCELRRNRPDPHGAIKQFERASGFDPQLIEPHLGTSIAQHMLADREVIEEKRLRHLGAGITSAERMLRLQTTSAAHRTIGRLAFEMRSKATARHHLEASIRLNSYHGDYAGLGMFLTTQEEHDRALQVMSIGMAHDADDPDLLAALGATYLELDQRSGQVGPNVHVAIRHLREALAEQPDHIFAVHNLAVALARIGDLEAAQQIAREGLRSLRHAMTRDSIDIDDLPRLQIRLADILIQRPGLTGRIFRSARALWLLASASRRGRPRVRKIAREMLPHLVRAPFREERGASKVSTAAGYLVGLLALVGLSVLWVTWLPRAVRGASTPFSETLIFGLTCVLLLATFAGIMLPRLLRLRLGPAEISAVVELSQAIQTELDLPETRLRVPGHGGIGSTTLQWTSIWNTEARFARLGPAVGALINGYYAHRDVFLPWRRL